VMKWQVGHAGESPLAVTHFRAAATGCAVPSLPPVQLLLLTEMAPVAVRRSMKSVRSSGRNCSASGRPRCRTVWSRSQSAAACCYFPEHCRLPIHAGGETRFHFPDVEYNNIIRSPATNHDIELIEY